MRVLSLHRDVVCVTSRVWQTTCTLVRRDEEAFCIDSPVLPDELELLPTVAEQSGFNVVGLLATHADWDHLLGRGAFRVPLGLAESSSRRLSAEPGEAARRTREFDDEWYLDRPPSPGLGTPQVLPVPGRCAIGPGELDLHPADGHTADGMAVYVPWARVLVCGDYLSPLEIPMLSEGGSLDAYLATLERLEPLVERSDAIVPGHGEPLDAERALAILREDRAYLSALRTQGTSAPLPMARRTAAQVKTHLRNVKALAAR